ncbi:MAG: ferritin family protein [candidate division WOR-3 bacterium]
MNTEALKALTLAKQAEQTSLNNYLNFALETQDETGKNMFIRLAMDEFDHWRLLEQQEQNLQQNECFSKVTIEPSIIEKLVPQLSDKTIRIRGKQGIDQISALRTALDLEDQAIKFYHHQAQTVPDQNAKAMYERLAAMEQAHYELLQAEIDAIEKTGFWFNIREFSLEAE